MEQASDARLIGISIFRIRDFWKNNTPRFEVSVQKSTARCSILLIPVHEGKLRGRGGGDLLRI
jgi:hypothetical protein